MVSACFITGAFSGGVSCFAVDPYVGLTPLDTQARNLSAALKQTLPPSGPDNTVSQISFSPSSSYLFASIKGTAGDKPGVVYAWPVQQDGMVSREPVISQVPGIAKPFGFSFLGSDEEIFMSDALSGGAVLQIHPDTLEVSEKIHDTVGNLSAVCWTAHAPSLGQV